MKKLLAVLLAAAMLFSFAACGGSKEELDNDVEKTTEAPVEAVKLSRGAITGDAYSNEFLGVTFTKPADWVYLSDKEIAETINIGQDALDFTDFELALAEQSTIYDMVAKDELYGNNIMVCFENTEISGGREITAEEYGSILKSNLEGQTALNYTFENEGKACLGDTEFIRTVFTAESNGTTLKQAYYIRCVGKYAMTVIVTLTNIDITDAEAMFS